jgi:hypothetical protein
MAISLASVHSVHSFLQAWLHGLGACFHLLGR